MNKSTNKSLPVWAAWTVGLVIFSLVFTAGFLSLYINIVVGATMGIAAMVMFALGDVGKMVLPIVMNAVGKNALLRGTFWMTAFVSFFCAALATADMFGAQFVEKQTAQKVESIGSDNLAELKESLKTTRAMMLAESKNKGCGKNCKALSDKVTDLERQVSEASNKQQTITTPQMSGMAYLGAFMLGVAGGTIDTTTAIMKVVMQMLMMELFSMMSGFAASMIGMAITSSKTKKVEAKQKAEMLAKRAADRAAKDAKYDADKIEEAARAEAEAKAKKMKLAARRRKQTIRQQAAEEARLEAEQAAKKKAAVEKRRKTLAAKKAAKVEQQVVEKPKRQWSEVRRANHAAKYGHLRVVGE